MARTCLDGNELLEMLCCVTQLFEHHVEIVNDLNVFPVPDGDTGTNMYLTLKDILQAGEQNPHTSAGQISASMAKAALMGGRGNSGTILSQIFKGLSVELEGRSVLEASDLPRAFQKMSELAYEAVRHPVEGTLLTVISAVAKATKIEVDASLVEIIQTACDSAKLSVAQTTSMLDKLRENGVVDSGGYGLLIILEGMRRYCMEGEFKIENIDVPEPIGVEGASGSLDRSFFEDNESEMYGNCIQFLLEGQSLDKKSIIASFDLIGESVVVVGDELLLKIHLHSDDTDKILNVSESMGQVKNFTVTDMDEQYREFSAGQSKGEKPNVAPSDVEVVALVWGSGFEQMFKELGVAETLTCKESVSPSVNEITELTNQVQSNSVILLCNDPNVRQAASQVSEMSLGRVQVLETITMPQGLSAMEGFDGGKTISENLKTMERSKNSVRTGVVCFATKSGNLNGLDFSKGDSIALLEQKLTAVNKSPGEVLLALINEVSNYKDNEYIALYWGDKVTEVDAANIRDRIMATYPDVAIEIFRGGQLNYHYILSFE
ncbi:MAG: DAK2 domain-containing protein [Chloroflexota bacterium]|nr:DAK2 domain-containing protein [Chloroflexota bacterium]